MGLLDKLQQQGSAYSEYDGAQPPVNPLATLNQNYMLMVLVWLDIH